MEQPAGRHPLSFVDVHTHLEMADFDGDRDAVIERARAAGLSFICTVGTSAGDWDKAVSIAERNPDIWLSIGLHPHHAADLDDRLKARIEALAGHPRCIAIGETGLDFHYDNAPRDAQRVAFEWHLDLARRIGKPVMLHIREAHTEARAILASHPDVNGILHCYAGGPADTPDYLAMGLYFSFPGMVTFPKATNIHDEVRRIPLDRILAETDAPYIAPVPHRGKRNEPAYVVRTIEAIAALKGVTVDDAARTIKVNAMKAFGLPVTEPPRIVYSIRNALYLNLTNACSNRCSFCGKWNDFFVKGHNLHLDSEPSMQDVLDALPSDLAVFDEIVFCGYGEPTMRLADVMATARELKHRGARRVRLNTDGLASRLAGRDVTPDLATHIDALSVSLNAADAATYNRLCNPTFPDAFDSVVSFIRSARNHFNHVTASAVAVPDLDIDEIRRFAESELAVAFRPRPYDDLG